MADDEQQLDSSSRIMLEELFAARDDRFLDHFRKIRSAKYLAAFVNRWVKDSNDWSREQIKTYLLGNLNLPGHEVVVRRIFKHFEAANDHNMLGVLMVAFDRTVRRSICTTHHYDWKLRKSWRTQRIFAVPNKTHQDEFNRTQEYQYRGQQRSYPLPDRRNKSSNMLFSHRTRNYFRRAAWRHFRFLSYRDPKVYIQEICKALSHYVDGDFEEGLNIIDNWSLMHACYFKHDAIKFGAVHTHLVDGHSLSELTAKPYQPELWSSPEAATSLLNLLTSASSTLVRIWSMELLQDKHGDRLENLDLKIVVQLINSPDALIQEFAARAFENHSALPTITVEQWLELLDTADPAVAPVIADAMRKHVTEQRLENSQLIKLCCAKPHAVSSLGFELLQQRDNRQLVPASDLTGLADCDCTTMAGEITPWALDRIAARGPYSADLVIPFFDVLMRPTRVAATAWLKGSSSAYQDPKLWVQLVESPFDDVRIQLVEMLAFRQRRPDLEQGEMTPVWVSVILGVHRGSRTKPKAIAQLADEISRKPGSADDLLPVIGVALRSIRGPEMRYALAALARLSQDSPELRTKVESHFREVEFVEAETVQ